MKRAVQAVIDAGQKVSGIRFEKNGFTVLTNPAGSTETRRQAPPRYAAFPIPAVTNFRR